MSRRGALALGALAAGSVIAGCSRGAGRDTTADSTTAEATTAGPTTAEATSTLSAHPSTQAPGATSGPKPTASLTPTGPAMEVTHGPTTRAEVALTFHGAGDPGIARELLAIFEQFHARVTVLAVGTWLESSPAARAVAREFVAAGHELGNHTYQHLDIDSLDAAAARREITRCRDALVAAVGHPGAHFRPSQTVSATPLVRELAGAAGYPVSLSYNLDSLDYTDPGPDAIRRNVATAVGPGSIVSLHFGHPGTVKAMPLILRDLAGRNLRAVTAQTLLRP